MFMQAMLAINKCVTEYEAIAIMFDEKEKNTVKCVQNCVSQHCGENPNNWQ